MTGGGPQVRRARAAAAGQLVVVLAGLALGSAAALRIVVSSDQWLRIAVWFGAAVLVHDLVAFPLYTAADRVLVAATGRARVPLVNHVRLPALGSLLLLVVFLPQISGQGDGGWTSASGLSPGPYLARWLVVSAALFALSGLAYGVRVLGPPLRHAPRTTEPTGPRTSTRSDG